MPFVEIPSSGAPYTMPVRPPIPAKSQYQQNIDKWRESRAAYQSNRPTRPIRSVKAVAFVPN